MKGMYIIGQFVSGQSDRVLKILNPASEEVIDLVPVGNAADVSAAAESASRAFNEWRRMPGLERAEMSRVYRGRLLAIQ